jgi:hypothetical protein
VIDIQTIKNALKLSEVVSEYVSLKPLSGKGRFNGKCCFHDDSNPSFDCDDTRGTYKCYGCGASGDVISFIQNIEGIPFKEAVAICKSRAGIIDEYLTPTQRKIAELNEKKRLAELARFNKWKNELILNLKLYLNAQWKIYRTAMRQMQIASTEELEQQAETAYNEALRKEAALEELEGLSQSDLMAYFKTIKSWYGIRNPQWCLSGKKLEMAKSAVRSAGI